MTERNRKFLIVALTIIALVFVLRSPSYNKSVMNWDESVYLLQGENILHGGVPYREIWDNKGALLYFIFAFILKFTGHSIIGLRLITVLWISASAFFIFLIGRKLYNGLCGIIAAIFFISASSVEQLQALASNAEFFYILPVVIAVYIALFSKPDKWNVFSCGVLCGLAFNIKSITVFDTGPIFLSVFFVAANKKRDISVTAKSVITFCLGFLIPLIVIMAYFQYKGFLNELLSTYFAKSFRYASHQFDLVSAVHAMRKFLRRIFSVFWPICSLPLIACLYARNKKIAFLVLWLLSVLVGILVHHRFFPHVFIQALPALCLLSAIAISKILSMRIRSGILFFVILPLVLGVAAPVRYNLGNFKNMVRDRSLKLDDTPAKVSDYLKPFLGQADSIYVVNYQPVIYFLTKAKIPTRFPFPDIFVKTELYEDMLGIDTAMEIRKILYGNPSYIIIKDAEIMVFEKIDVFIKDYLYKNYLFDKKIDNVNIYRYKYQGSRQ